MNIILLAALLIVSFLRPAFAQIGDDGTGVVNGYKIGPNEVLTGADLRGTDLKGANLTRAILNGAALEGADLSDSILMGTEFQSANLKNAKLMNSNFGRANLSGADLSNSNLTNVTMDQSLLVNANLQNTNLSFYHSKNLPKKHNHIFFYFKNFTIIFNDPRRFGYLKLIKGQTNLDNYFRKYGPEPLEKEFNFRYLKNYLKKKTKSIKNTLMDQYSISGIGNIYASEILNYSKVNPFKESYKINNQEINKIVYYTKKVLNHAIRKGGTSINNFQSIRGDLGSYQKEFRAYGREKEKCKNKLCSGTIEKFNISNRSTYLCNNCQKS